MSKRETPEQLKRKMERLQDEYEDFCNHPFLRTFHEHLIDLSEAAGIALETATGEESQRMQGQIQALKAMPYAHIMAHRTKMAEYRVKLDIIEQEKNAERAEEGNEDQSTGGLGGSDGYSPV